MKSIVWLTGLSASGKTTIGKALVAHIQSKGYQSELLDGDELRQTISKDLGFTNADRETHLRRVAWVANMLSRHDVYVVVAAISPIRQVRQALRVEYPQILEAFVNCPLPICIERDPKGLYQKALRGEIAHFTGVSDDAPYEAPENPHLILDTARLTVADCVATLASAINLIPKSPASLFIGRWQPFHQGHQALIETVLAEGKRIVIGIRDTTQSESNPYTTAERQEMIQKVFGDRVETIVVPDIAEVCIGREVGYQIREIRLPESIEAISGTAIRGQMPNGEK